MDESPCVMAKKRGPRPKPEADDRVTLGMKCSPKFKEWVGKFSRSERMTPSILMERSLAAYAKQLGFEAPPDR